jgi:hypothetical protein
MKVEYAHPDFPTGHHFDVGGILVPNGGSVEVDADGAAAFKARTGKTLQEASKGNEFLKVSGSPKNEGGDS